MSTQIRHGKTNTTMGHKHNIAPKKQSVEKNTTWPHIYRIARCVQGGCTERAWSVYGVSIDHAQIVQKGCTKRACSMEGAN